MSIRRWQKVLLIGVPLVLVVAGGVAIRVLPDRWAARCSAVNARVSGKDLPEVRFQSPEQFQLGTPAWSKQWWTDALAAAGQNPAPFGTFRGAVRIDADGLNGRAAEIYYRELAGMRDSWRGNVLLTMYPEGHHQGVSVRAKQSTDAKTWAIPDHSSSVDIPAGSDQMILADTPDGRARLTSISRDSGKTTWCQELGNLGDLDRYGPAIASVPSSNSLFLAEPTANPYRHEEDEATVMISRRNLADGKLLWRVPADGFHRVATIEPFQDLALVARTGPALSGNDRYRQFGDAPKPAGNVVQARAAADGSLRWTYRGPDKSGWMNSIVGIDGDTAVVLSQRDRGGSGRVEDELNRPQAALQTTSWLIGLGADGKERWRHNLTNRLYSWRGFGTTIASGVALSVEGDLRHPFEKQVVVARDITTGAIRWRTPVAEYTLAPDFYGAKVVGDVLVTSSQAEKLIAIDLRTGAITQPLGKNTRFSGMVADDQSITINASGLLLTFDRHS
ncbi:PQQ-binding-like beta-propeller repeat protein [Kribbella sp. NPDC056345]|uniref:outer membrane protein assembly factor BamB family protein n=1 Tax=Kribbella sp. NPDC056345 TaxID=3345789 RepID=UPI0035DCAADD